MHRIVALLFVSAAIVLSIIGVVVMNRAGTTPAAAKEMLTLIEHVTDEEVVDLRDEGDTRGDMLVFSNALYDDGNVNLVGRSEGSCIRIVVGQVWACSFTNSLENGSLVVEGPFSDNRGGAFAITGGTGDYSGATGQMRLTAAASSTVDSPEWELAFEIN